MAYINERLPTCVAYGFTGGPEWSTLVIDLDNGREQRNGQWLYPKHKYAAQYMNFDHVQRQEVYNAFQAMRGRLHCFRFKDHGDFEAVNQLQGPNIGTDDPMQLIRTYQFGSESCTRLIQAPVNGTVTMTKDGSPFTAFTVDDETGLITPDAPWGAGVYLASFQFDVWVRFNSDYNAFTIGNLDAHTADIELIEVRR